MVLKVDEIQAQSSYNNDMFQSIIKLYDHLSTKQQ